MRIRADDVDFMDFYEYSKNIHGPMALSLDVLYEMADTYCGLRFGKMPDDQVNRTIVDTMIEMGLLVSVDGQYLFKENHQY